LKKCEQHVILLSFAKKLTTGWHPIRFTFEKKCKTKWEPDEAHTVVMLSDRKNSLFAIDSLKNTKSTILLTNY